MAGLASKFLGMNRFAPIILFAVMMISAELRSLPQMAIALPALVIDIISSAILCILMVGFPWAIIYSFRQNMSAAMCICLALFAGTVCAALVIEFVALAFVWSSAVGPEIRGLMMYLGMQAFVIGIFGFIALVVLATMAYGKGARNSGLKANSLVTFFALFYFILGVIWLQPHAQKMKTTA